MPLVRGLWQAITGDSYIVDARPLAAVDGDERSAVVPRDAMRGGSVSCRPSWRPMLLPELLNEDAVELGTDYRQYWPS